MEKFRIIISLGLGIRIEVKGLGGKKTRNGESLVANSGMGLGLEQGGMEGEIKLRGKIIPSLGPLHCFQSCQ